VGEKDMGLERIKENFFFKVQAFLKFYLELKERTRDTQSFGVSTTPYVSFQY